MSTSDTKQIEVNGLGLLYTIQGKGIPIFFLHGTPGTGNSFKKIVSCFNQDNYQFLVPDRLGYGDNSSLSNIVEGKYVSTEVYSLMIQKLCENGAYIVGYSLGCYHALRIASLFPKKVKGLVLIAPYIYAGENKKPPLLTKLKRDSFSYKFLKAISPGLIKIILKQHFLRTYKPEKPTREKLNELTEKYGRIDTILSILSDKSEMCANPLDQQTMKKIACPCLVIEPGEDAVVKSDKQLNLLNNILNLCIKKFEKSGHNIFFDKYEEIAKEITEFTHL